LGVFEENKMQKPEIQSIDHIVMQAADLAATIKFYTEILGMDHSSFQPPTGGPVRQSLHFGLQKINLHDAASPFIPHAKNPVAGSVDLCFITTQPLADWQTHLADHGIEIDDGRFVKPAQMARFCQSIFVTPTII
jgi:catechol 2,3-dioxygenase-like lactoylglutathione lyase family enzyme